MKIPIQTVTTAGFSMDYICFGNGAETMVILPGLSVQSVLPQAKAIAKQYARFTDDYTVYLFDRRKELPPVYTVEDMANDTVQAMESLGLGILRVLNGEEEAKVYVDDRIKDELS